jgi:sulfite reductase (ferredoxin)
MKASNPLWTQQLANQLPTGLAEEIQQFEDQITLKKQGRLDDKVFMEARLRRGCYGQRYDNGQRHDGVRVRTLRYPCGDLTKGPNTVWDAPGMQRIKIPYGGLNARQLEVIAELAEEYADGVAHVTTRQDFQLHFVHLDDTPTIMRRLAAVGITTREACGNTVRNVTACSMAGICPDEVFDVTPYARACAYYLLGHPDCQAFGRKFKIAFSGCPDKPCGLARIHDIGLIARERCSNGHVQRGFEVLVGGGLGPVPYQAKLFTEFLPVEELLPTVQAIARIFAQHGEKRNRNRARMKFLVEKLGIDEFKRLVQQERARLPEDPAWASYLEEHGRYQESPPPLGDACVSTSPPEDPRYQTWLERNVQRQRQAGFVAVTVAAALGRHYGRAVTPARRHRAPVHPRYHPNHHRAELPASLGARVGLACPLPGSRPGAFGGASGR